RLSVELRAPGALLPHARTATTAWGSSTGQGSGAPRPPCACRRWQQRLERTPLTSHRAVRGVDVSPFSALLRAHVSRLFTAFTGISVLSSAQSAGAILYSGE